jgi:hypothetical protein
LPSMMTPAEDPSTVSLPPLRGGRFAVKVMVAGPLNATDQTMVGRLRRGRR